MSTPDFSTAENNQELATEVNCLKAMLTLMLQAMGRADAGRVILKMENRSRRWMMKHKRRYFPVRLSKLNRLTASSKNRLLASLSAGFASGAKHRQHVISDLSPQRSRQSVFIWRIEFLLHIFLMEVNGIFRNRQNNGDLR